VFRRLDRMRDAGPAVAVRSDHVTVGTAVQITAAAVLLQEGVERGEETTMGLPSRWLVPIGRMPGASA
jgi:hypothetical protein